MIGLGGSHGSFVSSLKRHHFGFSSLFFFLYDVVWTLELDHSLKQETLALLSQSLFELSASLSHSHYISHLCLSPSSPSATTSSAQNVACLSLWALCLFPSSPLATTDLSPECSLPYSLNSLPLSLVAVDHHRPQPKSQLASLSSLPLSLVAVGHRTLICES